MTFVYLAVMLAAFYLLLIAEFLIPSGGILGAAAVAMMMAAIVIAFTHSFVAGLSVMVFVLVTTPFVLIGMVRLWPHTPIGRRMLNRRPGEESPVAPKRTTASGIPMEDFVGRVGIAKTNLLPSGLVVINNEKLDAVSTGMPIDSGTPVIVTHVELGRLHVRATNAADVANEEADESESRPQSPPSLEGPLDSFDAE